MYESVQTELLDHVLSYINEGVIDNTNKDDWHYHCFNEDYYIIGYYQASQWLEKHGIDAFEAISTCVEYEKENFGEVSKRYDNAETTVNMLVYIYGEQLFWDMLKVDDDTTVEELEETIENYLND